MSSRDTILAKLRANRPPFKEVAPFPTPKERLPVTRLEDSEDLAERFSLQFTKRHGIVTIATDTQTAIDAVLSSIGDDTRVLSWKSLPLPGLTEALAARGIETWTPNPRGEARVSVLEEAEKVRVGITGVDCAFATTGTMMLSAGDTQGRITSLMPPFHIALLKRERIFPRLEDWIAQESRAALKGSPSLALISGPSATGDIESHTVFGAHGPEDVHVVIF
jgi:L-lactate dehydrogenase complex protein LldG